MESKKVTFTTAGLNSGIVNTLDLRLTIPGAVVASTNTASSGSVIIDRIGNYNIGSNVYGQDTIYRRPTSMKINNKTGADFEFNLISDATELVTASGYPNNYNKIKVYNNELYIISPMPKSSYMLGYTSGTVTTGLDVFCWGYV